MKNETTIRIPKKYEHMLDEVHKDSDGYWAYSKAGYYFPDMGCHTAHEDAKADLMRVIRNVKPCGCEECKELMAKQKVEA